MIFTLFAAATLATRQLDYGSPMPANPAFIVHVARPPVIEVSRELPFIRSVPDVQAFLPAKPSAAMAIAASEPPRCYCSADCGCGCQAGPPCRCKVTFGAPIPALATPPPIEQRAVFLPPPPVPFETAPPSTVPYRPPSFVFRPLPAPTFSAPASARSC